MKALGICIIILLLFTGCQRKDIPVKRQPKSRLLRRHLQHAEGQLFPVETLKLSSHHNHNPGKVDFKLTILSGLKKLKKRYSLLHVFRQTGHADDPHA